MKKFSTPTTKKTLRMLGVLVLFGAFFAAIADWSNPTMTPPSGNRILPVNVSQVEQYKGSSLSLTSPDGTSSTVGNLTADHIDVADSSYYGPSFFFNNVYVGTPGVIVPDADPSLTTERDVTVTLKPLASVEHPTLSYPIKTCVDENGVVGTCTAPTGEAPETPYSAGDTTIIVREHSTVGRDHTTICPPEYPYIIGGGLECPSGSQKVVGDYALNTAIGGDKEEFKSFCSDQDSYTYAVCSK